MVICTYVQTHRTVPHVWRSYSSGSEGLCYPLLYTLFPMPVGLVSSSSSFVPSPIGLAPFTAHLALSGKIPEAHLAVTRHDISTAIHPILQFFDISSWTSETSEIQIVGDDVILHSSYYTTSDNLLLQSNPRTVKQWHHHLNRRRMPPIFTKLTLLVRPHVRESFGENVSCHATMPHLGKTAKALRSDKVRKFILLTLHLI
jgi:hypothetical protein